MRWVILLQPFFGGEKVEAAKSDPNLWWCWMDALWKLSLLVGVKREHLARNLMAEVLHDVNLPPVIVCISERDMLKERNMEYYHTLKNVGIKASYVMIE
ncbi:hypothetical protein SUGI_0322470 [Cryptomeria japonica]|nr:hypothetical protein SUGI_0322470 [Cryptomeria japonica]